MDIILPTLDKLIEESKKCDNFSNCDFKYWIESIQNVDYLFISDINEYSGFSEFDGFDESLSYLLCDFAEAVEEDIGLSNFVFEPYDEMKFCGVFSCNNICK